MTHSFSELKRGGEPMKTKDVSKIFHFFWWPAWVLSFAGVITFPYTFRYWHIAGAIVLWMFFIFASASIIVSLKSWYEKIPSATTE